MFMGYYLYMYKDIRFYLNWYNWNIIARFDIGGVICRTKNVII